MIRRAPAVVATSALLVLAATLGSPAGAAPSAGRIVGHVRECNTPTHCIIQRFSISARDDSGVIVARTTTKGDNDFALRLPAGHYALTARAAGGLTCEASASAVAGATVRAKITCLVP